MPKLVADQSASEKVLSDRTIVLSPAAAHVITRLALSAEEGYLLSRVDQPMPVAHVLAASGLPESQALRLLLGLVEKGALLAPGVKGNASDAMWGSFEFNPAELGENVDLDPDQRRAILFRFHTLQTTSYWRLLGVDVDAPVSEVRRRYLELSKEFHPDAYFRKRMGSYLPKVEAIFHRLRLAWETLSDETRRAAYERSGQGFTLEEKAKLGQREISRLEEEERSRVRRERLLRARGFARLTRAREELAAGDRKLGGGDVAGACAHYELALELDPRLEEARPKLIEAQRVGRARRAELAYDEAMRAEADLQFRRALDLLLNAERLDPDNARVQLAIARLMFLNDAGAAARARIHVSRALELGLTTGDAFLLHGELLLALGQRKPARRQLELAVAAGERERAHALLKKC